MVFVPNQGDSYERLGIDSGSGKFVYNPNSNTLGVDNISKIIYKHQHLEHHHKTHTVQEQCLLVTPLVEVMETSTINTNFNYVNTLQ